MANSAKNYPYLVFFLALGPEGAIQETEEEEDPDPISEEIRQLFADNQPETSFTAGLDDLWPSPCEFCDGCSPGYFANPCPSQAGAAPQHYQGRRQSVASYLRTRRRQYDTLRGRAVRYR